MPILLYIAMWSCAPVLAASMDATRLSEAELGATDRLTD
jgi:hypothetical protein